MRESAVAGEAVQRQRGMGSGIFFHQGAPGWSYLVAGEGAFVLGCDLAGDFFAVLFLTDVFAFAELVFVFPGDAFLAIDTTFRVVLALLSMFLTTTAFPSAQGLRHRCELASKKLPRCCSCASPSSSQA